MEHRNLGRSGLKVSAIGLGTHYFGWLHDEPTSVAIIDRALELGINFIDTADVYDMGRSEEFVGKAIRGRREELVIATKFGWPMGGGPSGAPVDPRPNARGGSRHNVIRAAEASLKRLGTDYIDLYQIHRFDPATPIEETMEALHDLVRAGKVRYLGASSMWAWQFAKMQHAAERHGWTRFISMQNHYNLVYREEEREMIPLVRDQGVGLLPWSPLARGFLAGNRGRDDRAAGITARARTDDIALKLYYQDSDFEVLAALQALAVARDVSSAKLAYAWLLARPGVTAPIVGASQAWQLEEAVQALEVKLTTEDMVALEEPYRPHPVLGHT